MPARSSVCAPPSLPPPRQDEPAHNYTEEEFLSRLSLAQGKIDAFQRGGPFQKRDLSTVGGGEGGGLAAQVMQGEERAHSMCGLPSGWDGGLASYLTRWLGGGGSEEPASPPLSHPGREGGETPPSAALSQKEASREAYQRPLAVAAGRQEGEASSSSTDGSDGCSRPAPSASQV